MMQGCVEFGKTPDTVLVKMTAAGGVVAGIVGRSPRSTKYLL
jgi:hypothetical protein